MPNEVPQVTITPPSIVVPSRLARIALAGLITPYGIQASNWERFEGAVFGRDSEAVAQDVDTLFPEIFQKVMSSLIPYQGKTTDALSGEEPGRTFHELRFQHAGSPRQQEIYSELSRQNGIGRDGIYLDYGTLDATPQLIRTVFEHVSHYGPAVLRETVPCRVGELSISEAVRMSALWISGRINQSAIGLVERIPTSGIAGGSQTLRDGATAYLHEDGHLADFSQPVASIDVQGLAYDALLQAAVLTGTNDERLQWRTQAEELRLRTFDRFWIAHRNNWAMAIDRDADGKPRLVTTSTTLPAELLATGIFENLPDTYDLETFVAPLVKTVFSADILTAVGPRTRSLNHAALLPYADYQGSWTVWPVSTNIISKGLHRYGFHSLERDLTLRTLAGTIGIAGSFPEFIIVNPDGEVCWPLIRQGVPDGLADTLLATDFPELNQAWTVSAVLRMSEKPCSQDDQLGWRAAVAEEVRQQLLSRSSIVRLHPYRLDQESAIRLERQQREKVDFY